MINYISFSFTKRDNITTQQLHLFEHCISVKVIKLIEQKFKDKGIIINAETFTDSCIIEIYFSEIELLSSLIDTIQTIRFYVNDLLMIEDEKKIILQETYNVDLTEEDKLLYIPLSYFSNENILDLYEQKIDTESILILFNNLISHCNITYFQNGILRKKRNANSITLPNFKSKWELENDYIVGCFTTEILSLKHLILCKFISFTFGKSNDSIIYKEFLKPYNLYLGYTIDLSITTSFYALFLIETNHESRKKFLSNPLTFKELSIGFENFKKQLLAFKTYMFMSDPLFLEINRFFIKSGLEGDINMNLLSNIIDEITYADIVNFWESCDLNAEK